MRILAVEPGKEPEEREITRELKDMQEIVGGDIEAIYPFEDEVALVCNEEGILRGLPMNRGIIAGTFFLCGAPADSEEFASLTDKQIETLKRLLRLNRQEGEKNAE